jgi:nucleotide-binding universal stress UspA family protein
MREEKIMTDKESARWTHPAEVLVATNLSDLDRLMPFAIQMAADTGAKLILLHVLPVSAAFNADPVGMPYYDPVSARSFASDALEPWCRLAREQGLKCEGLVHDGHPAREIIAAARHFHVDRVLLGTRSRSRLGKLLLGSVAEQVLRSVHLPVFTIGPEAHLPEEGGSPKQTVLFATALGEGHLANAALACQIAASHKAKLVLLHVLPPIEEKRASDAPNIWHSTVECEMRHLARRIGADACPGVEIKVVWGNPAVEILAEACADQASLIVLGAANETLLDNITHDRTVYRVLAHARCPVLTLHRTMAGPEHAEAEVSVMHG